MRNAELAEIRARLQAAAAEERERRGLAALAGLRALWPRRPERRRPAEPAPLDRPEVGPSASVNSAALQSAPLQSAFGQRADLYDVPLQLDAPLPPEPPPLLLARAAAEPQPARRRRARRRTPARAASPLARLEQALLAEQAALEARRSSDAAR